VLRRRATTKAPAVVPGTSSSATGPPLPGGTGRPPGPLTQGALEQLLEIIEALREWWFAREQLKQQEDAARAARRAQMSGFGDFFTGLGQGVQSLATAAIQNASGIAQLVSSFQQPQQVSFAPTGSSGIPLSATAQNAAMQLFQQPQQAGVMDMLPLVPGIDDLIANLVPSNGGGGSNGFFKTTATGVRSVGQVHATNPKTGRIHVFADLGRPVLYSGDIATCKRVKKVARRTAGASGLRFRPVAARRRRR
jgi:hypothetical protein